MVEFFENLLSNLTLGQALGITFGGVSLWLIVIVLFKGWREDYSDYE